MNRKIRTWVEISLNDLEHNYREISSRLPDGCQSVHLSLYSPGLPVDVPRPGGLLLEGHAGGNVNRTRR